MILTLSRTSAVLLIAWVLCAPFTLSAQTRPTESVESPQASTSTTRTSPTTPTTTPTTGSTTGSVDQFTSLTQLPGIPEVSNAASLPDFFNNLYRLCIGAAAVIAVLQIMRAGIKFMTKGGSVSANSEAKDMIRNAVIGLILVLSPAIVFGIINPRILNLELNLDGLQPTNLGDVDLTGDSDVPIAGVQTGPTVTETGTLLRTVVSQTEEGMNTFISQCSAKAKSTLVGNIKATGGKVTTKGCTRTCTPAGQGTCDAKGCNQYTAYCSVQVEATVYASDRQPTPTSTYIWNEFTKSCQAAGGNPQSIYSTSQPKDCTGPDDKTTKCYDSTLTCSPK